MENSPAAPLSNGIAHSAHPPSKSQLKHFWLITGPAGCGKSTVATYIANVLNIPYLEGDDYHSDANIAKMSTGVPLDDQDRWDWLISLRTAALATLAAGSPGVVVTCSALKQKYREVMRVARYYDPTIRVHFVFLHASEEVLLRRVGERQGHYMGANMVRSQLAALEQPRPEELDIIPLDVSSPAKEVEAEALKIIESVGASED